ncbi:MAG TPA: hypothetical protein VF103_04145 [Polyangiaceae bacterium]
MAERPPDPKDVRVSMVDKGWSESPPAVREAPPPPPPLPKDKPPPPPPLPGERAQSGPTARKADEITRDESPDISEIEDAPSTENVPRELPLYEEAPRELLVTRVDDQIQARAFAMNAETEDLGEKTAFAAAAPAPPPPPPLPGARSSPTVSSSPRATSSPNASSSPVVAAAPPPSSSSAAAPAPPPLPHAPSASAPSSAVPTTPFAPKSDSGLSSKVRTAAWPIQVVPPVAASAATAPRAPASSTPIAPAAPAAPAAPVALVPPVAFSAPSPAPPLAVLDSTFPAAPSSVTMVDQYGPVSTIREALLGRVRVGKRPMPLWAVLAPFLVLTAMLAALAVGVFGGKAEPSGQVASAASGAALPDDPSHVAAPTAADKGRALSLLEKAAIGEQSALSALEQKKAKELGTDEALAIARGKVAQDVQAAKKLRERLAADPGLAKDKKVVADLLRFAHGRETTDDALATMAALPGPLSADLVYEVWTGTAEKSDATELARAILLGKDVRPKASPALSVALELREATTCEESQALLSRAIEHGDKRALVPINRLARKTGCGPSKKLDCYPCLRDGDLIKRAFNAVRVRREPELLR